MPLYLVRWANLSAAIVKAVDEDDLLDQLDMVGDSTGARWKIYKGPLHVEFDLDIPFELKEPKRSTKDIVFGAMPESVEYPEISFANSDVGAELHEQIFEYAFPNIQKAIRKEDYPSKRALKAAAAKDLAAYLQASWQRDQLERSTDPDAALAIQMGANIKWVKSVLGRDGDAPAPKPTARKKKKPTKLKPSK